MFHEIEINKKTLKINPINKAIFDYNVKMDESNFPSQNVLKNATLLHFIKTKKKKNQGWLSW